MLTLRGGTAYSKFRLAKLLGVARNVDKNISAIHASYRYFISVNKTLSPGAVQKISALLSAKIESLDANELLVVPRFGTISPWSSKATEIVERCGLSQINRVERGVAYRLVGAKINNTSAIVPLLHDPMTATVLKDSASACKLFEQAEPTPLEIVDLLGGGVVALQKANIERGFALSPDEIEYLHERYVALGRDPTDVELMMFAQLNSEHCRHKIFNADWQIDQQQKPHSLFDMIRHTHEHNSAGTLVAYDDNAAVIQGYMAGWFYADPETSSYSFQQEPANILAKVETHNHPTAIAPFAGAATGAGGEIRDEGATGIGGKPKAGLTGFAVSNLRIPGMERQWEHPENKPQHIASPLNIMLEGPIGSASFSNEFGRPVLAGYFRTFELPQSNQANVVRGYHKPIMLAGGMGNIRDSAVRKKTIPAGAKIIVLGGPAMLIGLGGGAASSMASGSSDESLDFASVQRSNPELQRRCQEVIDRCWAMGEQNPILSLHDVGAGGLSNALPELVHDAERGGVFMLRDILSADHAMSPMQIWCNEAQERYVLAVEESMLPVFEALCKRERCLYCIVGEAVDEQLLRLQDSHTTTEEDKGKPIDLSMDLLFGKPPKMQRDVVSRPVETAPFDAGSVALEEAIKRVLRLPSVADKSFLITIGDRSITGLVCRDQMIGPWQVPVADVAVTASGYQSFTGEAMAMGERPPLALLHPSASARMAVAEAVTNIAAANIDDIKNIKLSANWMVAAGEQGEDAALYEAVEAIGLYFCPELGISIPVGKDSMSMKTLWQTDNVEQKVVSPLSLNVTAFAPVKDVRKTLTPLLDTKTESCLLLIDLGNGKNRLGACALTQVYGCLGEQAPDVEAAQLKQLFNFVQAANNAGLLLAYHDRSDGGLISCLLEMAFASRCGLNINLDSLSGDVNELLFNEECGVVIQIAVSELAAENGRINALLRQHKLLEIAHVVGSPAGNRLIRITRDSKTLFASSLSELQRIWSETSYAMQRLRDNPDCADQEYARIRNDSDTGLFFDLSFDTNSLCRDAGSGTDANKPRVAILREQGVNGHIEMAAAFDAAGFDSVDVTMTDLMAGRRWLHEFCGFVACGGFSYGDVLGAGLGWAKSILYDDALRTQFENFFTRPDTFALGVCNGCQMMSGLKDIIPGAEQWPGFVRNESEQFEARLVQATIVESPSLFFKDMQGSSLPVVVAHGEGKAVYSEAQQIEASLVSMRFADCAGSPTMRYPNNPNGSPKGATAFTTPDGRFTILMPHPERVIRNVSLSWHELATAQDYSPWLKLFQNAKSWVDQQANDQTM